MFVMTSCLYCKGVTLYHCVMACKYVQPMHQARVGRPVHAATPVSCLLGHSMSSSNPSGDQERLLRAAGDHAPGEVRQFEWSMT